MLFHVITYVMSFYKTCDVMLYNTCYACFITYVMLYNICHVCYITCVTLCYITYVMFVI